MKRGYKETEIGEIPVEWGVLLFNNIADKNIKWSITGGPFGSNLKADDYTLDGVQIIQLQNIGDGIFIDNNQIYTSEQKANELISCNIYPNEIILSKMGDPVARACFIPNKAKRFLMASDGIRLVVDTKQFSKQYIFQYINSVFFRKFASEKSTGSTRQRIGLSELKAIPLAIPPLPEQKKIAEVLSSVDEAIRSTQAVIDQTKLLKQGLLNQLLTKGIGHKKFKQAEIGEIPVEWEVETIGELSEFRRGSFPQPYGLPEWYDKNGSKFIQVFDIGFDMRLNENTKSHISDLATNKSVFVPKGSLVVSLQGSIGRVALTQYDAYADRTILIFLKVDKKMDIVFFSYIIQRIFNIKKDSADGGIIKTITVKTLDNFLCSIPPVAEQKEITKILLSVDKLLLTNNQHLEQLKTTKSGLMQDLLTGKKRVSYAQS